MKTNAALLSQDSWEINRSEV